MDITKETAILTKEKGFNIPCWNFIDIYNEQDSVMGWIGDTFEEKLEHAKEFIKYYLPIQSELQKWLRDIHNIDVQAYLIEMISNGRQLKQTLEEKEYTYRIYQDGIDIFIGKTHHNLSYEQALEIGLQEALKLIGNKVCKHEWIMTADSFDQTCYCKKCGKTS